MIDFNYLRPASLEEAFEMLEKPGNHKILAGGTDLVVGIRDRKIEVDSVVSLADLAELHQIEVLQTGDIRIGSACRIRTIVGDRSVAEYSKAFVGALSTIGSNQIRNRASLGGNICNASPAADSVPLLLTFDAEVEVKGRSGSRRLLLDDFLLGRGKIDLKKGELLASIILPNAARRYSSFYEKVGVRSMDISMVSVAISLLLNQQVVERARIALGSVASRPVRAYEAEEYLETTVNPQSNVLKGLLADEVSERESIRASSVYRREIVKNLTLKGLSTINSKLMR